MRKLSLGVGLLALTFMLNSCKKDVETSEMVMDMSKTATLVVYAYAELDQTKIGLEKAPDGTQIMLRINYNNFNAAATGYWTEIYTIQGGKFEATIPTINKGVTVEIFPFEFIYDQVQPYNSLNKVITKLFSYSGTPRTEGGIKTGETRTHELTYGSSLYDDYAETVKRSFKLVADLDATVSTFDAVPNNTKVIFYSNSWSKETIITNNQGNVDNIDLPSNQIVTIRFETAKKVYIDNTYTTTENRNYLYEKTIGPFTTDSPVRTEVNCGSGVLWQ